MFLRVPFTIEGYSKMVTSLSSANERARVIRSHVSQYNKLVDDLERSTRPPWLPEALVHAKLDVNELLSLDADDERWEKMWESLWNSSSTLDKKPPPFVADPDVRRGIAAVLSLARIEEEKKRLAREELNGRTWIFESVDRLLEVADYIHRGFPHSVTE